MIGSHCSVAGGLHNALTEARQLDFDCVQVFTKNQRTWQAPPLLPEHIETWRQARSDTGIDTVISHDSYLINLASPKPDVHEKSLKLMHEELTRCDRLDIPFLVTHPGAHLGDGEEVGLGRVAAAFDLLHEQLPDLKVITCLEITAGQGTSLGYRLEHLQAIIQRVAQPHRLAVCLDTAHLLAAGYDLTSASGFDDVVAQVDQILGLEAVRVIHVNDSKVPRSSRVDRHEHIGKGHIPLEVFAALVNHPQLKSLPMILETEKADAPDGRPWDAINAQVLRDLMKKE